MNKSIKYLSLSFILFFSITAYSQWSCPSKLANFMRPIKSSGFSLGSELIGSGGYITNNYISTASVYLAADYTKNKHNIYIEGGFKFWDKYDIDVLNNYSNYRFGLREAFYNYTGDKHIFQFGLQSAKISNSSLLNERIMGAAYRYKSTAFNIDFRLGTVREGFSRNGLFCNTAYIYDFIPNQQLTYEGFDLFETNLAMVNISFKPSSKSKIKLDLGEEEIVLKKKIRISSYGFSGLAEFGSSFSNNQYGTMVFGGGFINLKLFDLINLKNELIYQSVQNNNAAFYIGKFSALKMWDNNTKTSFNASLYANISGNTKPLLSTFSNILAGEVMRLGSGSLPLWQTGIKHHFMSAKTSIKLEYTHSMSLTSLWEVDLKIGYSKIKRLHANLILSYLNGIPTPTYHKGYLARLELRYYL